MSSEMDAFKDEPDLKQAASALEAKRYRKTIISVCKRFVSKTTDTVADCFYLYSIYVSKEAVTEPYLIPLFVFTVISCMTFILSNYIGLLRLWDRRDSKIVSNRRKLEHVQLWLEDLPQFVLTAIITKKQNALNAFAVFNLVTSATAFVFGILDMIEDMLMLGEGEEYPYL